MTFAVELDADHALVRVTYRGTVSIEQRSSAMDRTLALLEQTGYRRILIGFEEALLGGDGLPATNAFATRVATNAALRQCRIAFVGPPSNRFNVAVENLARARGYGFERFFEYEPALAWLLQYHGNAGSPS